MINIKIDKNELIKYRNLKMRLFINNYLKVMKVLS